MSTYVLKNIKNVLHERCDIVIENQKIKAIAEANQALGDHVIDCSGQYFSGGWIDLHVHACEQLQPYGDTIDEIGVKHGVTTIVDAGSCGADTIAKLYDVQKQSKTNVFALLNISSIGLQRIDELSDVSWIDEEKCKQAMNQYGDFIVGLKARMSKSVIGNSGIEPLQIAKRLSNELQKPLMVHIGSAPPKIEEVLPYLMKNDVITHCFHGKSNRLFIESGKAKQELKDALQRGVKLDAGHGTASFSFQTAKLAKQNGITCDTISTDIYRGNRLEGPVYDMATTLSKFLYLGYSLEEIIDAVTINAANWLGRPELGSVQVGEQANITIFSVIDEKHRLIDSEGVEKVANKKIIAEGVFVNGEYITC